MAEKQLKLPASTESDEFKRILFAMESVCILTQELLSAYRDDDDVIQSFLTDMNTEDMEELKSEIDKFIVHLSEIDT